MDPYVVKLSSSINNFQEKVEELDILLDRIEVFTVLFKILSTTRFYQILFTLLSEF